jgi:hypothetical protein
MSESIEWSSTLKMGPWDCELSMALLNN